MKNNPGSQVWLWPLTIFLVASCVLGGLCGLWSASWLLHHNKLASGQTATPVSFNEDDAVVEVVAKTSPAVVSIIVSKNLPKATNPQLSPFENDPFFQQFFGNMLPQTPSDNNSGGKQEIGGGSGFIVSSDGYIVTNKHVVADTAADYTVMIGTQKYSGQVIARDPINDLALLKIDAKNLPTLAFGDSDKLKVGQRVVAIGNALGQFSNTVSTGVVSGLARSITAGSQEGDEQLVGLIQTDASINPGNSGDSLLNIAGQVVGINVAMAEGAQNIGFAIPANQIKTVVDSVRQNGRLIRPWLGIRYIAIDKDLAQTNKLPVDHGVLIVRGDKSTDLAVVPGSPADIAGLTENDIILAINGQDLSDKVVLATEISKLKPGDEISLKILSRGKEKTIKVKLVETPQ